MAPAERQRLVQAIKSAERSSRLEEFYGPRPMLVLVELGDTDAIADLIQNHYHPYGARSMPFLRLMGELSQPRLIAALSADLMAGEKIVSHPNGVEGIYPAKSVAAADVMKRIIINAPEFSKETKDWALSMQDYPRAAKREAFQTFWRENATHLAAEDYAKVAPPQPEVRKVSAQSSASATSSLPAIARPPTKRPAAVAGSNTATPPQTPSTTPFTPVVPAASAAPAPVWPWLLLASGIFTGWLWWRSR